MSWPQALSDHLYDALGSPFQATKEALSEGLHYIAFHERLSNVPFNIGYLWGKLTSYLTFDISTAIPTASELLDVPVNSVIPAASKVLDFLEATVIPVDAAISEAVLYGKSVARPIFVALGQKVYDSGVTIVTLPAKLSDFLHDLLVILFENITSSISTITNYLLTRLSIPSFEILEPWFKHASIPSFKFSAVYETISRLPDVVSLEWLSSSIPDLPESHAWALIVPTLKWLIQGVGRLSAYEYSFSATPWLPESLIRLFQVSPSWFQNPVYWCISQWEWLLLPAFDFVGTSRIMFLNIFLVFIVYICVSYP